ncbi:Integrase core domain-containing protein [Facklamia miroungae]|uniref:Integrase core domain-containing protein n=1 Tax=Facklamia miroungae TaxID=120956 RepID=A0A1G7NUG6_9LACT|nr:IS30 family transposase [Facklamia miroungae]SDF77672.1 Integrase core domain-containing protein [Facklamia miroungae]
MRIIFSLRRTSWFNRSKSLVLFNDCDFYPLRCIEKHLRSHYPESRKAFEHGPRRRKILGKSVEERPQKVEDREEWGHWEIDTVVGPHGEEEPTLLTLVERHSRFEWLILIKNQTSQAVHQAITHLMNSLGDKAERLFKTLTSDNGSEFSSLTKAVSSVAEVNFAHPYSSWERGTSENQHRLVRRYIPKGESLARYTQVDIDRIQQWMNDRPRKLLGYATAHEVFVKAWKNEQKTA